MRGKIEVMGLTQNKALHSRSELVFNPQPHVQLTQLKKKKYLTNKWLVLEEFLDEGLIQVELFHQVAVKFLKCVEVVTK